MVHQNHALQFRLEAVAPGAGLDDRADEPAIYFRRGRRQVEQSPRAAAPIIALITEYGEGDFFVASIKTIILSIRPKASTVDISHFLPADSAIPIVAVLIFVFQAL